MNYRLAEPENLSKLLEMYTDIYKRMNESGVILWNEHYPYDALPGDIQAKRLWLLCSGSEIAAAFALDEYSEISGITWHEPDAPAAVIMRLGVSTRFIRQGLGKKCVEFAGKLAAERGWKYLRLLVAECNKPAEEFYVHCGFARAEGIHIENMGNGDILGCGYEIRT